MFVKDGARARLTCMMQAGAHSTFDALVASSAPCVDTFASKTRATPSEELAAELMAFAKTKLAPYKYPRWIEFVA
jgi:hypothetical protein